MALRLILVAVAAMAAVATAANSSSLNFVVIGDWGGQETKPFTTADEIATGKEMSKVVEADNSQFVLALGDNFYSHGISTDVNDHRFKDTFEDAFTQPNLNAIPWNVLAGNHDHIGNVSAEVAYSQKSKRWNMPSLYYDFEQPIPGTSAKVHFVMIDTVILAGNTHNKKGDLVNLQPQGPEDVELAETQWQWIESTLAASKAEYLMVAGHYPVWSICEHGPTELLVLRLKPLLEKYNVTGYMCGHDHCNEFINEGTDVDYHVIGAAHSTDPSTAHKDKVPKDSLKFHFASGLGGFAAFSAAADGLVANYYSNDGTRVFTSPPHKPRQV